MVSCRVQMMNKSIGVLLLLNIMTALGYVAIHRSFRSRNSISTSIIGNSFISEKKQKLIGRIALAATKQQSDDSEFSAFADLLESDQETTIPALSESSSTTSTATIDTDGGNEKEEEKPWQKSLDELLDPTTNTADRQILLSKLVGANEEIRGSLMTAIRDRKIDPILTPNGKKIQNGSRAVARQLTSDILPSIAKNAQSTASSDNGANGNFPFPVPSSPVDITKVGSRIANAIQNQVQTNIKNLQEDLQNPVERIPERIRAQSEALVTETKNVFAETPVGLNEPPYTVVTTNDDYEIRQYESYKVATTNMGKVGEKVDNADVATTGAAFNTLAAYIFGANEEGKSLEMTTPVTTTSWGEMRFYVKVDGIQQIPSPLVDDTTKYETGSVEIRTIPPSRLAVRRFTGFVTEGEVNRQKEALLAALSLDNVELDVAHGEPIIHQIFQYNPPYTIPIVRRNEIAIPVLSDDEDLNLESKWATRLDGSLELESDDSVDEHFGLDDIAPSD